MRVMPFVQVLLLLLLLSYLLFVALENPGVIHLPLPFGRGEYIAPIGTTITAFLLAGGIYSSILFLPVLIQKHTQYLNERREKKATQQRLAQSLQARLGAVPRTNHLIAEELIETPASAAIPIIEYTMPPAPVATPPSAPPATDLPEPKVNLEKPHDRSRSNIELLAKPEPEPVKVDLTRPEDYKRISDDLARSLEEYLWQEETQATKQEMEEILVQTKMAVALSNFDSKCEFFGFGSTQYDRKHLDAAFNIDKPDIRPFAQSIVKTKEQEAISAPTPTSISSEKENISKPQPKAAKVDLTRPVSLKRPPKTSKTVSKTSKTAMPSSDTDIPTLPSDTPLTQHVQPEPIAKTASNTHPAQDKQEPVPPQPTALNQTVDLDTDLKHEPAIKDQKTTEKEATDQSSEFDFTEFSFDLDQFDFNLDQLTEDNTLAPSDTDHTAQKESAIHSKQSQPEPQQKDSKEPKTQENKSAVTTSMAKVSQRNKVSIKKNKEKIKSTSPQQHPVLSLVKKTKTSKPAQPQKASAKPKVKETQVAKQSTNAKLSIEKSTKNTSSDSPLASTESEPNMPPESQQPTQATKDHLKATEQ